MVQLKPIAYVIMFGVFFWGCIFYFGFFQTVTVSIVSAAVFGLWIRLTGRG